MTVVFPKWSNKLPPVLAGGAVSGAVIAVSVVWYWFSPWNLDVGYQPHQPVLYSHQWHAGQMGMDCRYCHQWVERGPHATVPATETCMNCHAQVKTDSPRLARLVDTFAEGSPREGMPVPWKKVHLLPDYVYFNHSAHVNAGVGCSSCHGRVDQMEEVRQVMPLSMGWCLDCHRDPEPQLRPAEAITDMSYLEDLDEDERRTAGGQIRRDRGIFPPTHCSACHR